MYIHMHACIRMHAYVYTYLYMHMRVCAGAHSKIGTVYDAHAYIHTCILAYTYARMFNRASDISAATSKEHACVYEYMHTYLHIHMRMCSGAPGQIGASGPRGNVGESSTWTRTGQYPTHTHVCMCLCSCVCTNTCL